MRSSLFLKVYITLIACLAIVAVTSGVFVRRGQDEEERGWLGRRDAFLTAMLPAFADRGSNRAVLDRLAEAFDADITVFDEVGRPLASTGRPLPPESVERAGREWRRSGPQEFAMRLPDGRFVAARLKRPFGPDGGVRRNPIAYLILIAGITGIAAYPVVRHLTRRLERLKSGVRDWGGGALAVRVPVDGKDEVAAVAATFNQAADRIERLVASHRSLLANASHELRSPLARLRMAIDLHATRGSEQTRQEMLRNIAELDELVEEILVASRLDHVDKPGLTETVDLLALAAEEGARAGVAVTGEAATVSGDPRLLTRLIRNLLQNAERHGAPPVEASVSRAGDKVVLAVRDHGPGIPGSESERVFEAFYRPSGHGEAAGGWGLGLGLVRQIARHHGGEVRHETPPDGGARFVVTLPAAA